MDPLAQEILLGLYPNLRFVIYEEWDGMIYQHLQFNTLLATAVWSFDDYDFFREHDGLSKIDVQVKMVQMALREKGYIQ